jgi:hypothetical protein
MLNIFKAAYENWLQRGRSICIGDHSSDFRNRIRGDNNVYAEYIQRVPQKVAGYISWMSWYMESTGKYMCMILSRIRGAVTDNTGLWIR